jgi:cytochrome c oxidase cbb3-type subunit 1
VTAAESIASDPQELERSRLERVEVDSSLKSVVVVWVASAGFWLFLGTLFAMLASHKLTTPEFLGSTDWLTFGRVRPSHLMNMAYGWLSTISVPVALWMLARLCRAPLRHAWLLLVGAGLWNVGNLVGTFGILAGDGTSIEWLEYPGYATPWMLAGLAPVLWCGVDLLRRRVKGHIYVSQWYLYAGLFWFPLLFITAQTLLIWRPVATIAQPPINWWYAHNVLGLWFTPVGLAAAYYLIPKVIGRPIHSYYLSAIGFWSLAFFYAWNGMHHLIGGPFPGWLISASVAASVMMFVPVITVAINHHLTMVGHFHRLRTSPTLRFVVFGAMAYTAVSLQGSLMAFRDVNKYTHFTHYTVAHAHLGLYAFATMIMFGSVYYMLPRVLGREWPSAKLITVHFWCSAVGITFYFVSLTAGGTIQGFMLQNAAIPFIDTVRATIPYLHMRTWAGVILTVAHLSFLLSLTLMLLGWTRREGGATLLRDLPTPEVRDERVVAV